MFNPHQFVRPVLNTPNPNPTGRIIIQKLTDFSKSRWDEPITVPEVLYLKFKLPLPASSKQFKKIPLSLVDYIKKAYDRCKDEIQTRYMENQLKQLIAKYQDNLNDIDWVNMQLPQTQEQKKNIVQSTVKREPIYKKQIIQTKQHEQRQVQEAPSKAQIKMEKTLQKLEEKLSKREEGKQSIQTKTFIGFKSQPEQYQKQIYRSEIRPSMRVLLNPPPPPPAKKQVQQSTNHQQQIIKSNKQQKQEEKKQKKDNKFVPKDGRLLNIVQSVTPEPIVEHKNFSSKEQPKVNKQSNQGSVNNKGKIVVTMKQLNQISKVAERRSDLQQVAKRYESFNKLKVQSSRNIEVQEQDKDDFQQVIVGKSTCIDKPYLRITGRPDPDSVRPETVLRQALFYFLKQHRQGQTPYDNLISQFKSIRQDLTVQHIRSSLTVQVYQQNFKMSLFQNDIIQVKQCQANLWELYREGLCYTPESRDKFISYHFITLILQEKYKELQYMLTLLPQGTLQHIQIQDSLNLKRIFLLGNYRAFFDYYNSRDTVCRQLLNFYIDKVKMKCLVMFCKTCGEKMSFELLGNTIGQDGDVLQALAKGQGAVIRQGFFMLKQSYQALIKSDFLVVKKVTNLLI